MDFCTFACVEVFDFDFFEFPIPKKICVGIRLNFLRELKKKYEKTYIFLGFLYILLL